MDTLRIYHDEALLREVFARPEESLHDVLTREGLSVPSPCGGAGTCGKCTVSVHEVGSDQLVDVLSCQTPASQVSDVFVREVNNSSMVISMGSSSNAIARTPTDIADASLGVAFDIGTTTIVVRLYNLVSHDLLSSVALPNAQSVYGADVVSRISAAQNGKLALLHDTVNATLAQLIHVVTHRVGLSPQFVERIALAGNTTMLSLAAGIDPSPIGVAPFTPKTLFGAMLPLAAATECGCTTSEAYFAPCIAGYVGSDITADVLASRALSAPGTTLLIDIGTNGELSLVCDGHVYTCATAAGPVFEGGNISCGMPAYAGAIAHVAVVNNNLQLQTIHDDAPCGICGTGLIDVVALLLDYGALDETGYLRKADEIPEDTPAFLTERLREDNGVTAFWLTDLLNVTQKDIRNLQLAKAAICAGVYTLLDEVNAQPKDVTRLLLAGGFGEFLQVDNAARIGLFPKELRAVAECVGNLAIEGISETLLQGSSDIENIAQNCSYAELSTSVTFNSYYIDEMEFPT